MNEKEALQSATDEARKAARAARELASLLDDYAKYLTQPSWRERANELHVSVVNKLGVVKDGLANSDKWVAESARSTESPAPQKQSEEPDVPEETKPSPFRVHRKGARR